ncbi:hypothetical protein HDU85_000635 [Gaertneriomyces sp. JEL0708]|nr:hypothetical protein HDU85_000635 [Gaertneriomyces sp. JEL0708]
MDDQTIIARKIPFNSPEFKDALDLRENVLRKPLGLSLADEDITVEEHNIHFAAFLLPSSPGAATTLVGTVQFVPVSATTAKLRQMAVSPDHQGLGIGRKLIQESEQCLQESGLTKVIAHARLNACRFYEKLGYRVVGDVFEEVGIEHMRVEKDLKNVADA